MAARALAQIKLEFILSFHLLMLKKKMVDLLPLNTTQIGSTTSMLNIKYARSQACLTSSMLDLKHAYPQACLI